MLGVEPLPELYPTVVRSRSRIVLEPQEHPQFLQREILEWLPSASSRPLTSARLFKQTLQVLIGLEHVPSGKLGGKFGE